MTSMGTKGLERQQISHQKPWKSVGIGTFSSVEEKVCPYIQ
jgi:hypothetical protein